MTFLFISVAIVCCIHFVDAVTNQPASDIASRSSVIFFKGTPGVTDIFLAEDQELQNLLNVLTTLGGPLGALGKFSTVLTSLATSIKNAVAPINALKTDYIFLTKNIDTYATSQGKYNFPTSKVDDIVTNLQTIVSTLQNIQKGLTKLISGGNSVGLSIPGTLGLPGLGGIPANPLTTQLNLIGTAATKIQSFLSIFTNASTSGSNTVVDLNDFMKQSLTLLDALPNFNQLITSIITAVTSSLTSF